MSHTVDFIEVIFHPMRCRRPTASLDGSWVECAKEAPGNERSCWSGNRTHKASNESHRSKLAVCRSDRGRPWGPFRLLSFAIRVNGLRGK
jgi:hypothetical protein